MNQFTATDQNEAWWNPQWLMHEHVMTHPVVPGMQSVFGPQNPLATVGHALNVPLAYSDHQASESTVQNAASVAAGRVPGT